MGTEGGMSNLRPFVAFRRGVYTGWVAVGACATLEDAEKEAGPGGGVFDMMRTRAACFKLVEADALWWAMPSEARKAFEAREF